MNTFARDRDRVGRRKPMYFGAASIIKREHFVRRRSTIMRASSTLCYMGVVLNTIGMLKPLEAAAQAIPTDSAYETKYDLMRRVIGTIAPDPDGSGPLGLPAIRNTYDIGGRLVRVETGVLTVRPPANVNPADWVSFTVNTQVDALFDTMDREITRRVSGAGAVAQLTQSSYNSRGLLECTAVRMDPAFFASPPASACVSGPVGQFGPDRITRKQYDPVGRLVSDERAIGTPQEQVYASYTLSDNGKITSIKDANGNKSGLEYDGFDRQSRWLLPSLTAPGQISAIDFEAYEYDANGNRISLRKRDGRILTYGYDTSNRLTSKIVPDGCAPLQIGSCPPANATRDVYSTYDLRGLQTAARFDSMTGDGISTNFNGFGEVGSTSLMMNGVTRTLIYQFDTNGNRTRVAHPDGTYFEYVYDRLDRAISGSWWTAETGAVPFLAYSYNDRGLRANISRGGAATAYVYDGISRPLEITQQFAAGVGDLRTTFAYNPADQIVSQHRSNDAYAFPNYVSVDRPYASNSLNQYSNSGSNSFIYDANGNLTSEPSASFVYDAENRLVQSSLGVEIAYDPLGRLWRTSTESGAVPTNYLYDGNSLVSEFDADSGSLRRRYAHGVGTDEPVLWAEGRMVNCSNVKFLTADHQGSVVALADCAGAQIAVNRYDEYGIPASTNFSVSLPQRFQYTGQIWLPELGLYYYKARIYSPTLGRFLQTDPIGYSDHLNLYAYVGNDPVNGRDPTGMIACDAKTGSCPQVMVQGGAAAAAPPAPVPTGSDIVVTGARAASAIGAAARGLLTAVSEAAVAPVLAVGCALFCESSAGIPDELAKIRPLFNKPPADAADPQGAKAPGKPGAAEGFADPKGGPKWGKAPNGKSGWVDDKGNVWVPTGPTGAPTAHGGSHWDVQKPGGGYTNIYPGGKAR